MADDLGDLAAIVEALIFASPDPVTPKMLARILDDEPAARVTAALATLRKTWADRRGLALVEVAGGYQIVTRPEWNAWVSRLFQHHATHRLSPAALETLAVIAYRQPVTGPEIGEIRGVNVSGVLGTLLENRMIRITGRKAVVGRPFLYATTREFLMHFGLKDLRDLPKVEELADLLRLDDPSAEAAPASGNEAPPDTGNSPAPVKS